MTTEQLKALEDRIEADFRAEQVEKMKEALRAVEEASKLRYRTSNVWNVVPARSQESKHEDDARGHKPNF